MAKKKYYDENGFCEICGKMGVALHHVKSRGAGGGDNEENLMPLCQLHHNEVRAIGLNAFAEKHDAAYKWLAMNGWQPCAFTGRWVWNG